jgi:hypothetical protein
MTIAGAEEKMIFVQSRVGDVTNQNWWYNNESGVEFWDIARQ